MDVTFLIYSKRDNSTARPKLDSTGAYTASVSIYGELDVLRPALRVRGGPTSRQLSTYNYVYIPKWGRYYHIANWRYAAYDWICNTEVDVLASWREFIGNYNGYVLRSATEYDPTIHDSQYPMTCQMKQFGNSREDVLVWTNNPDRGCYSVVMLADGLTTTYLLNQPGLAFLLQWMFSDAYIDAWWGSHDWATSNPELRVTINPAQYIQSIRFLPWPRGDAGTAVEYVYVGRVRIQMVGPNSARSVDLGDFRSLPLYFTFREHPQAATRGRYLNRAPYSAYALDYPAFGHIQLPPDLVANHMRIETFLACDYITGICKLSIWAGDSTEFGPDRAPFMSLNSQVGVPLSVSNIAAAGGLTAPAVASAVASGLTALSSGSATGVISTINSAVDRHVASLTPTVTSVGSRGGSVATDRIFCDFTSWHYMVVDEDREHLGRPLCKRRKLSTLPGYQMVQNGDISIPGYAEEQTAIKSYLEGGYYYE